MMCVVGVVLGGLSGAAEALPVLFYDDFDDGNYDGWVVRNAYHPSTTEGAAPPDIVALSGDEGGGYAIFGVGSGYGEPYPHGRDVGHDLFLSNIGELKVEFRARSGLETPNHVSVPLVSGSDHYLMRTYGEGNRKADFRTSIGGIETWGIRYDLGGTVAEWHVYAWTRDATGWWSLSVDGDVKAANFYQDNNLTSFDQIGVEPFRNQSGLDWIRISAVPEPATMGLLAFGGLAVLRRRKRGESK